jgi:hypothetical protein
LDESWTLVVVTRGVVVMADVDLQVVIVVSLVTLVTVECKVIVVWILACQNQQGHLIMSDLPSENGV